MWDDCVIMSRSTLVRRWKATRGELPAGLQLNHHCDTPSCVNFDHVYVGTQMDNSRDARERGRSAGGRGMKGKAKTLEARAKISEGRKRGIAAGRDRWAV